MIKRIPVTQLCVGMYVHDLHCGWMDHPFFRSQFLVDDEAIRQKIVQAGIRELSIDTARGLDVPAAAPDQPEDTPPQCELSTLPGHLAALSPTEEYQRAKKVYADASKLMQNMMHDVRLGKQLRIDRCEPMIEHIVDSMFSLPSALLPLAQIKTKDEYTFQHSVSVAALTVAFGRVLDLPRDEIGQAALGGFLHDVGKARVPGHILNKPGKLTDDEFVVMRDHASHTAQLLKDAGLSEIAFNAASQHNERYDGSGYPQRLQGEQISLHGQMLAIVDVYDALTSLRVYHKPIPPTEALRRLMEGAGSHFNTRLVHAFIKGIGIYPAGSLVRMQSGKLGIVRHVSSEKLLQPVVQLIFDCTRACLIPPEVIDLAESDDKVESHESFEKWGIDPVQWVSAPA